MIKYALRCANQHEFEVWFNSIAAYDEQRHARQLRCPVCDSDGIEKALMAPSVVTTKGKTRTVPAAGAEQPSAASPVPASGAYVPVATAPPPAKVIEFLREMRSFVEAHTEDVGKAFAEEARKIHYEEAEPRGIRGEATTSELRELDEEGITVAALPRLPEDQN
ncbi:MAG: hypothetical protein APF80_15200 [Alphaproteobacteria bacterium BRH_c36]|nr:MAG: hypothetical protein APF80_15200 [Alphaproteobacteria bacterium BRH_c36]